MIILRSPKPLPPPGGPESDVDTEARLKIGAVVTI